MREFTPARSHVAAALLVLTAALFARSWLQLALLDRGFERTYAADLAYLVVWPGLVLLLLPVLQESGAGLCRLFDPSRISVKLVLGAIATGFLIRVAWWCQLIAGISFGIYNNADASTIRGPLFEFQCPGWTVVAVGFLVMAILVPVTEEVIHRGYVQSSLNHYGPIVAIAGSTAIFTVFHSPTGWIFVFFAGVVLGTQYWFTKSLWASLCTHVTVNGLIQLDWRCLRGQWNPPASDLPMVLPGSISALLFVLCVAGISANLWKMHRGDSSPR